jgi:TRAP-type C4-dicarboxylate transport system permease small subunit
MLEYVIQLSIIGLVLLLGLFGIYVFINLFKSTTPFQKLNRFTVLAVLLTFFGLIFLRYSLLNSALGSTLVLLLIRISYVIYIDTE